MLLVFLIIPLILSFPYYRSLQLLPIPLPSNPTQNRRCLTSCSTSYSSQPLWAPSRPFSSPLPMAFRPVIWFSERVEPRRFAARLSTDEDQSPWNPLLSFTSWSGTSATGLTTSCHLSEVPSSRTTVQATLLLDEAMQTSSPTASPKSASTRRITLSPSFLVSEALTPLTCADTDDHRGPLDSLSIGADGLIVYNPKDDKTVYDPATDPMATKLGPIKNIRDETGTEFKINAAVGDTALNGVSLVQAPPSKLESSGETGTLGLGLPGSGVWKGRKAQVPMQLIPKFGVRATPYGDGSLTLGETHDDPVMTSESNCDVCRVQVQCG